MNEEMYTRDLGAEIYQMIINDIELSQMVPKEHVFQYHIPEEFRAKSPVIRITVVSMTPTEYADNKQLAWDYTIQIDCWAEDTPFYIAQNINRLMKRINFKQSSPIFEYDEDTEMLRDGRRYDGKILINE